MLRSLTFLAVRKELTLGILCLILPVTDRDSARGWRWRFPVGAWRIPAQLGHDLQDGIAPELPFRLPKYLPLYDGSGRLWSIRAYGTNDARVNSAGQLIHEH